MHQLSDPTRQASRVRRWGRAAILVALVGLGQIVIYGPSLVGSRILLPLDLLTLPGWYLGSRQSGGIEPHDQLLTDLVLTVEPRRQFAAAELRSGRLPLWNPYNFAGSPTADLHSPFDLLYYALPTPYLLAWLQLLKALVTSTGAFLFFRRALGASFWPGVMCAACWPVTAFFVLWQGYTLSNSVVFLPWILLATDRAIRNPAGAGGPSLALLCGAVLSTELGTAGQMLIAAGIYALWCAVDEYAPVRRLSSARRVTSAHRVTPALRALGTAAAAVVLGAMLAMPLVLPLAEYATTGVRTVDRASGREERPPVGLSALPEIVLPDFYGSSQRGSRRIVHGNRLESSAAAYAGVLATLVLAPLAFTARTRRSQPLLWLGLFVLGVAWCIDLPGAVQILRLPGLNLLSHNRFVFLASFAALSLAALGLSQLERGWGGRRAWFALPAGLLLLLAIGCAARVFFPPEPLARELGRRLAAAQAHPEALAAVQAVVASFASDSARAAAWCALGVGLWLMIGLGRLRSWMVPGIGALALAELLTFAYGIPAQSDPELMYPDVPVFSRVAKESGRALCVACLPPALNRRFALRELRGYDGIDPVRIVELLESVSDPRPRRRPYAVTTWFAPRFVEPTDGAVRIPPALDMLGLRFLIFNGPVPRGIRPLFEDGGFWVVENPRALPRVFVPHRFETVADSALRLEKLAADDFDPREVAYLEVEAAASDSVRGTASITREDPQRIEVAVEMEKAGLVVLADLWDVGWHATLNGGEVPILRVNHAVRGVRVPAGSSSLVFRYAPRSFAVGAALAGTSLLCLLGWVSLLRYRNRGRSGSGRSATTIVRLAAVA